MVCLVPDGRLEVGTKFECITLLSIIELHFSDLKQKQTLNENDTVKSDIIMNLEIFVNVIKRYSNKQLNFWSHSTKKSNLYFLHRPRTHNI